MPDSLDLHLGHVTLSVGESHHKHEIISHGRKSESLFLLQPGFLIMPGGKIPLAGGKGGINACNLR